ncbi:MAG: M3 family metallopeptidase [Pyrinomonadaceae bacterium]
MESPIWSRFGLSLALVLSLTVIPVHAQTAFEPIPQNIASSYHFNLSHNFFPTPAAAEADRTALYQALADFSRLRGTVAASAENLYQALRSYDSLQAKIGLHWTYLYLRYAMDTRDTASADAAQKLDSEATRAMSFLQPEIVALDESELARFLKAQPALRIYAYAVESMRRYRPHTLSPEQDEFVAAAASSMIGWQGQLFSQTLDTTNFGLVHTPEGDLDLGKNRSAIINHPDRAVRAAGFKQNRAALASRRDTYAFALLNTVKARDQLARTRRFPDYPAQAYFDMYLTRDDVTQLLEQLAEHSEINKRYERLLVERIKRTNGYSDVHFWELAATATGTPVPRFTISEASRVIRAATAPLGSDYEREMAALLDPANGRLDIAPAPNRVRRPGFSNGGSGRNSVFYSGGYEGYLDDVIILAHEGGHAVQNMLMNSNRVLPVYASGPNFFTESFAGFNELLLLDYLYRNAHEKALKIYFLERFLTQAAEIFKTARESLLEQQLYDEVVNGSVRNAGDIEALTQRVGARFSIWFGPQSEVPMEWVNTIHYYTRPMYRINYVYSKLLAIEYFDLYTRDTNRFITSYQALLRNGYDVPPDLLLQRFIGTNSHDPLLVSEALKVVGKKIDELERLYASPKAVSD